MRRETTRRDGVILLKITEEPIDPAIVYDLIGKECAGSIVFHYAVAKEQRDGDGMTSCIEYDKSGDPLVELRTISADLKKQWQVDDLILMRRVGCLGIGDIISLVAASSPNSEDSFAACRHGIARLKKMATIRKTEIYS